MKININGQIFEFVHSDDEVEQILHMAKGLDNIWYLPKRLEFVQNNVDEKYK